MADCIFCKIARHELPSQVIYENEQVIVFNDINPAAPVHLLVIPKLHVENICSAELLEHPTLLTAIMAAIQGVVQQEGLSANGFRVVVNRGRDAGEAVPHLHFHILAGRLLGWPPG